MAYLLQFWVLLLLYKQALACVEEGPCRELAFPSFLFFANKRLVNYTIKDVQVGDMGECERLCYEEHNCVSINFERKKNGDGKYHCELNNSTHGEHDQDLVDTENYFYRGTKNACGTTPCRNGGTCQSGFTKKRYRCLCPPGFTGGQCQQDINECDEKTHRCNDQADCVNTRGSYMCLCKPGYTGDGYDCTDIDECNAGTHYCIGDAQCSNTQGSFYCTCKLGYFGDGHTCTDVDECDDGTHNCSNNADCSNARGSYNCTCKPGYFGDGRNCTAMMDSVILSNDKYYLQHLGMFLASTVGYNCRWKLCYRTSTHGDSDRTFHANCDGKRNTVTIVKKDDFVFGGFTDIVWDSPKEEKFGETPNAFIFSLRDAEGLAPFNSMVQVPSKAILNVAHVGPTFGENDLRIDRRSRSSNSSTKNFGEYYQTPDGNVNSNILAGTEEFQPDEVEVFYLV